MKIKNIYTVTTLLLALVLGANTIFAQEPTPVQPSGAGTSGDPYLVASLENLYWITQNSSSWDKYFKQTADIDASSSSGWASGAGFSPIGNSTIAFSGTYDGDGHFISGIYISTSAIIVAFFGNLTGTVTNLGLIDVSITATVWNIGNYAGGLVGVNNGTISYCYTTGVVSGQYRTGGLVGYNQGGTINNCFSRCNLNTGTYNGGLVGSHLSGQPITKCYSTGAVSGNYSGGLIAFTQGTATDCYWDIETSGQTTSAGGTGKTTAEMKTQSTFTDWDFTDIWVMDEGYNDGYPYLRAFYGVPVVTTQAVTAITQTSATGNGTITSTGDSDVTAHGVCWSTSENPTPTIAGSHTDDGAGSVGGFTSSMTGLTLGTTYYVRAYATNSQGTGYGSQVSFETVGVAPSIQATNIVFSAVYSDRMTVGCTNGDGSKRVVFGKQASIGTTSPVDGTTYTASTTFGSGTQIGSTGWYCVYSGSGSSVKVVGLSENTAYIFQVFEYNGSGGSELYLTSTATDNPKSQSTNSTPPPLPIQNYALAFDGSNDYVNCER